jgi:hypothetical protein
MPVFFQKISDDEFNIDSDFVVKESKTMNVIVGIFFLILSIAAFTTSVIIGGLTLFIAIGAFAKSTKDVMIMKINKNGFYYYGELITNWEHFISEEFIDEMSVPDADSEGGGDNFF